MCKPRVYESGPDYTRKYEAEYAEHIREMLQQADAAVEPQPRQAPERCEEYNTPAWWEKIREMRHNPVVIDLVQLRAETRARVRAELRMPRRMHAGLKHRRPLIAYPVSWPVRVEAR